MESYNNRENKMARSCSFEKTDITYKYMTSLTKKKKGTISGMKNLEPII